MVSGTKNEPKKSMQNCVVRQTFLQNPLLDQDREDPQKKC